jgi:tetratricopeptide (TPR) repeat protein/tRNA A-37 threonylcarbamoyl transferase component Bud32
MPQSTDPSRDLLFGLLALQNGLIDQGVLFTAFAVWTQNKARSLADRLVERGGLDADGRAAVEAMVAVHIKKHGGDVEKSLAAIPAARATRESLIASSDPQLDVGRDPAGAAAPHHDHTVTFAVGSSTSLGRRFQVLRPHASGGLGAVYVALDSELNREVALKQILDRHADDPTSRSRFLLEAEVTGGLEHPGIVPVYGLGTFADGRPYYAMRFIRGESLKETIERYHADESLKNDPGRRSLELRKLLRRFVDVCNAIDYAHSRGVLHRDIKPGNIIVGKHGETLVVDWGLAKATGQSEPTAEEQTLVPSSASGSAETLPGSAMGTPAYMSPEQARGDLPSLGPHSDVYSLGATLYCLLTGDAPFDGDVGEILYKVQKGDFRAPRTLDPSIDQALEAICVKAMAIWPEDRYTSSRALADDLELWAADEQVLAWAEPWTRKLLRWLTRHRTGVTGTAAALLAGLVGLAGVFVVQSTANARLSDSLDRETRTRTALHAANLELASSRTAVQVRYDLAVEAIKTFHTGASEDFLLKQEQFKELRDRLLKSASDFYGKLGGLLSNETDFASQSALAASNFELATLTAKVGHTEDALAAHRAVLAARETLVATPKSGIGAKIDVGRSLTTVASLLEATGKTNEALAAYQRAESVLKSLTGSGVQAHIALAECRSRLGSLYSRIGRNDEALTTLRLARADQEKLAAAPAAGVEARRDLADTVNRIARLRSETGRPAEAEAEYRTALTIQRMLAEGNPAVAEFRFAQANSHNNLAIVLVQTGRAADAEAEYRAALSLFQNLAESNLAVAEFRYGLANTGNNLGMLLSQLGRPAMAGAEYRKSVMLFQALAENSPSVTTYRSALARSHGNLGILLAQTGRPTEAEAEFRTALEIRRKLANDNPAVTDFKSRLAMNHSDIGRLLSETGRAQEAEAEYHAALAILQTLVGDNPAVTSFGADLADCHNNLGLVLWEGGKRAEAEAEYRTALKMRRKLVDDNPTVTEFRHRLALSHNNLGHVLSETDRLSAADAELRAALAIRQKLAQAEPGNPAWQRGVGMSLNNLGELDAKGGHIATAVGRFRESVAIHERLARDRPTITDYRAGLAFAESGLGRALCRGGSEAEGVSALRQAITLREAISNLSIEGRYDLACCHALLAAAADDPRSGLSSDDAATESDRAMAALRAAVAAGYRDLAKLRTDSDLAKLRDRDDFRELLLDLAMPADPFSRAD